MTEITTPQHPRWDEFYKLLNDELEAFGCSGDGSQLDMDTPKPAMQTQPTHWLSRHLLTAMQCDVDASIELFKRHGGYCDCEVLFNVDPA